MCTVCFATKMITVGVSIVIFDLSEESSKH